MKRLTPEKTILFLGAGSSIPSGAPSVDALMNHFAAKFGVDRSDYDLSELSSIIENKTQSRKRLIKELRSQIDGLTPTGGIQNLGLYKWKSIYTTNYDKLIELSYEQSGRPSKVISSNFDFDADDEPNSTKIFKIHGTIDKDVSDGYQFRLILTQNDYALTDDYREALYDRFRADLNEADVLIIGYSLSDPHIKQAVDRALKFKAEGGLETRINLLIYQHDENRAELFENRGIDVAFGGIDEFFSELAKYSSFFEEPPLDFEDPLSSAPQLRPVTIDTRHAADPKLANSIAMYNGWPASHADIAAGLTFERILSRVVEEDFDREDLQYYTILAASGFGKTTCARQILRHLRNNGYFAWEHHEDRSLQSEEWVKVAKFLDDHSAKGVLFIDDAHLHVVEINMLVNALTKRGLNSLKLIFASSTNLWSPRVKVGPIFKAGKEYNLKKLAQREVDGLLNIIDNKPEISRLIDKTFLGYSRSEKRRRLVDKFSSDPFVCLKNVFASENFDDIILREFSSLDENLQEVYRSVAAMEDAGVRVHRQLVIRMLNVRPTDVQTILEGLEGIVMEYDINRREAVFGWRGRHPVIVSIIARYKFFDEDRIVDLFENVIESISPSYEIEIRTIREICSSNNGIGRLRDRKTQNRLFREIISRAPQERIPRHRLIKNLIIDKKYDEAATEIRVFEKDFKADGAVARLKVRMELERARHAKGLMEEDRTAILLQAANKAEPALRRYSENKHFISQYIELGMEIFRRTGNPEAMDHGMEALSAALDRLGDPDIARTLRYFERRISGQ